MNNMVNRIVNSNQLFTLTIVLSLVLCVCLSRYVESKPNYLSKLNSSRKDLTNSNTQPSVLLPLDPNNKKLNLEQNLSHLNHSLEQNQTSSHNEISNAEKIQNLPRRKGSLRQMQFQYNIYDYGFIFRLSVFILAFSFVIFISLYVKSLNRSGVMYGYLDTRCGDEERLMKQDEEFWDDDDEVVMFDAVDFKKTNYKE